MRRLLTLDISSLSIPLLPPRKVNVDGHCVLFSKTRAERRMKN
jgi:hypothetical protein